MFYRPVRWVLVMSTSNYQGRRQGYIMAGLVVDYDQIVVHETLNSPLGIVICTFCSRIRFNT